VITAFPVPAPVATDLQQVEQLLVERTQSRAAVISVAGSRLLRPEGVRLRAALVLMAARTGVYSLPQVLHAAAAVELIHAATQTHDDLIDHAERRRGRPATGEWSDGVALMVGDYLFALAAGEMALAPDARVIGLYAHAVQRITESALLPMPSLASLDTAMTQHMERLGGAADLVAAACRAGGACVNVLPEQIEALGTFGYGLGLGLRLGDEIRDLVEHTTAETPARSIRAGLVSLPLLFAAQAGDAERLVRALDSGDPTEQRWATGEAVRHGLPPAREQALEQFAAARLALETLPPSVGRAELGAVVLACATMIAA
jgi:geranylgeranyl pyrophosphate synthase